MNAVASSKPRSKNAWMKTMHQWHWVSAAISLAGLILFSITGVTLNNAALFEGNAKTTQRELVLPTDMHNDLQSWANTVAEAHASGATSPPVGHPVLPANLENWLDQALGIRIAGRPAEVSADEVYVSLPEPGGDAWLAIDLATGDLEYERIHRGAIAYLNDLHKGRHSGIAWRWFIDILAVACLVFAITGLVLLKIHGKNRPMTWPVTSAGVVIPVLLMLLLVH
ncbi:PepSY-associated TM helix domain-containing protein [Pusillimonas minor]|uniref:PepSY-associated TM helix domain-containing protein n=1 Tax=Pusillimonas minor TaxID=2697024 RepID=A0A842HQU7_9BURK|nr:PepSY-associated TM helix domain-containing protein [Pusillimonas minor]MBC2769998.1 PepSY-associated TM helix domain-containing protein [Pusillimonas minor]